MSYILDRRTSLGLSLYPSYNLTAVQVEEDQLVNSFTHEASNWQNLAAMMAGGLAYRLGKIGVCSVGAIHELPLLARLLSPTIGLATEVSTFRGVNQIFHNSPQPSLILREGEREFPPLRVRGGEGELRSWLTDYFNFATLKFFGKWGQNQNPLLTHFIQDAGMVAGHQLTYALHLSTAPQGTLAQQFIHAESTNIAMAAGMSLGHFVTGEKIHLLEKSLDLSLEEPAPSSKAYKIGLEFSEPLSLYGSNDSSPRLLDAVTRQKLTLKWSLHFRQGIENYGPAIIRAVLDISFDHPQYYDNLLEAYSRRENASSLEQIYLAKAVQELFDTSPAQSSTGSFEGMLLQHLLRKAISEHEYLREYRLGKVLQSMEDGITHKDVLRLIDEFGYAQGYDLPHSREQHALYEIEYVASALESWGDFYSAKEQDILLHFMFKSAAENADVVERMVYVFSGAVQKGRYPPRDIHQALAYAHNHPLGFLVLQRIFQIFAVEDSSCKLREIFEGESSQDSTSTLTKTIASGAAPQLVVQLINGSRTTAFIRDERLARKVVSVLQDVWESVENPFKVKQARRKIFERAWEFLESNRPLTPDEMIWIMEANPTPQVELLKEALRENRFDIKIVSEEKFQETLETLSLLPDTTQAFFVGRKVSGRDLVVIKELPAIDMISVEGKIKASHEIFSRIFSLIHEWEHWRHSNGNYQGIEVGAQPVLLSSFNRHERIVGEIMAFLEEERWKNINFETETWKKAKMLGENWVMFLRNLADRSYYERTNQRLLDQISEP